MPPVTMIRRSSKSCCFSWSSLNSSSLRDLSRAMICAPRTRMGFLELILVTVSMKKVKSF